MIKYITALLLSLGVVFAANSQSAQPHIDKDVLQQNECKRYADFAPMAVMLRTSGVPVSSVIAQLQEENITDTQRRVFSTIVLKVYKEVPPVVAGDKIDMVANYYRDLTFTECYSFYISNRN